MFMSRSLAAELIKVPQAAFARLLKSISRLETSMSNGPRNDLNASGHVIVLEFDGCARNSYL